MGYSSEVLGRWQRQAACDSEGMIGTKKKEVRGIRARAKRRRRKKRGIRIYTIYMCVRERERAA